MQQYTQITEIKEYLRKQQSGGARIGLVPTMGYLHEGHLSLIRRAVRENDITVVSIFVNPIQFGPNEDLAKYPRDLEKDLKLIQETGAAVVFIPSTDEMYGADFQTYIRVEKITKTLCGASRPGHFQGVTTVVSKLFHIVRPDQAYFGQKDVQQALVIKKMVQEIVVCPIVREVDGLAMSSRNVFLNVEERQQAVVLYQALRAAQNLIRQKETDAQIVKKYIAEMIHSKPLANIDYIAIVSVESLQDIHNISSAVLIALAVKFGNTRLIDNIMMEV
jgi:pantoate--beta-alanine ligase